MLQALILKVDEWMLETDVLAADILAAERALKTTLGACILKVSR